MKTKHQAGLSLPELMIALTLSLILVLAVTSVFLTSRQTSKIGNAFSGIQENARFATQVMGYDLRNAGHAGCNAKGLPYLAATGSDADNLKYVGAVSGWSSGDAKPAWLAALSIKAGTDVLKIQYASTNAFHLSADMAGPATAVSFTGASGNPGVGPNVIADCSQADLFSFAAMPSSSGSAWTATPAASLSKRYLANEAEVMAFLSHTYYVGADSVLRRYSNAGAAPEDIADNVEDFSVLYGIDTDGNGTVDKYVATLPVPATYKATTPLSAIKSVQLCLLLTNTDEYLTLAPAAVKYTDCHGVAKENPKQRFHQIFRTTVTLRNGLS